MISILPTGGAVQETLYRKYLKNLDISGNSEKLKIFEDIFSEFELRWSENENLAEICRYSFFNPGKMLRPFLLVESARIVGGDVNKIIKPAVGVESAHIASLMHDDIIDNDDIRRGKPSSHVIYGQNDTIVAADALIFDLFATLAECAKLGIPSNRVVRSVELAAEAGKFLCEGQVLEGRIKKDHNYAFNTYLQMIEWKTAVLFKTVCEVGGILGGGNPEICNKLGSYGLNLGIAFQMVDDLLPYISETSIEGKNLYSDILNNRPTLPIIIAYMYSSKHTRKRIEGALYGKDDIEIRARYLNQVVDTTNAVKIGKKIALGYVKNAKQSLLGILADSDSHIFNLCLERVIERCR